MIDMGTSALIKKSVFSLSGKLLLSDAVRNFAYQWAWSHLDRFPKGSAVCDIGARSSLFPAFLAWKGLKVDVVEKDKRFTNVQKRIAHAWGVRYGIREADFLTYDPPEKCRAVCSLFSLQHAGDDDVPAYRRAAALLVQHGLFLSACEYDDRATKWHNGRDDGTMRIYGPLDIVERIENPLVSEGMEIVERRYAGFTKSGRTVSWRKDSEGSTFFFLCGVKK